MSSTSPTSDEISRKPELEPQVGEVEGTVDRLNEAPEWLRKLYDLQMHHDELLALVPNHLYRPDGSNEIRWEVIDVSECRLGDYEGSIIASRLSPADAVDEAEVRLGEGRQG